MSQNLAYTDREQIKQKIKELEVMTWKGNDGQEAQEEDVSLSEMFGFVLGKKPRSAAEEELEGEGGGFADASGAFDELYRPASEPNKSRPEEMQDRASEKTKPGEMLFRVQETVIPDNAQNFSDRKTEPSGDEKAGEVLKFELIKESIDEEIREKEESLFGSLNLQPSASEAAEYIVGEAREENPFSETDRSSITDFLESDLNVKHQVAEDMFSMDLSLELEQPKSIFDELGEQGLPEKLTLVKEDKTAGENREGGIAQLSQLAGLDSANLKTSYFPDGQEPEPDMRGENLFDQGLGEKNSMSELNAGLTPGLNSAEKDITDMNEDEFAQWLEKENTGEDSLSGLGNDGLAAGPGSGTGELSAGLENDLFDSLLQEPLEAQAKDSFDGELADLENLLKTEQHQDLNRGLSPEAERLKEMLYDEGKTDESEILSESLENLSKPSLEGPSAETLPETGTVAEVALEPDNFNWICYPKAEDTRESLLSELEEQISRRSQEAVKLVQEQAVELPADPAKNFYKNHPYFGYLLERGRGMSPRAFIEDKEGTPAAALVVGEDLYINRQASSEMLEKANEEAALGSRDKAKELYKAICFYSTDIDHSMEAHKKMEQVIYEEYKDNLKAHVAIMVKKEKKILKLTEEQA